MKPTTTFIVMSIDSMTPTLEFYQGPTHWLVNVNGDPNHMQTACGQFE